MCVYKGAFLGTLFKGHSVQFILQKAKLKSTFKTKNMTVVVGSFTRTHIKSEE